MTTSRAFINALPRWIIGIDAVVFGVIGVGFLFWPQALADWVGIVLTDPSSFNDFRAVYGGVPAGLAAFLVMAMMRSDWTVPALWMALLTFIGLAGGRFLSEALDGPPGLFVQVLQVAEIAGALFCVLGLRLAARDEGR